MAAEKRKLLILDPKRPPFTSTMIHTPFKDSPKLSITYSSGLIPPPEHMSTLAVFYDKIWLPSTFVIDNNLDAISYYIDYYSRLEINYIDYYSRFEIPAINIKFKFKDRQVWQNTYQIIQEFKELYTQKLNNWKQLSDAGLYKLIHPGLKIRQITLKKFMIL